MISTVVAVLSDKVAAIALEDKIDRRRRMLILRAVCPSCTTMITYGLVGGRECWSCRNCLRVFPNARGMHTANFFRIIPETTQDDRYTMEEWIAAWFGVSPGSVGISFKLD